MKKFKTILTKEELTDHKIIDEYLKYSFRKRSAKKDIKLYVNLCQIYELYPKLIQDILNEIPKLGYFKDYFYILSVANNINLEKYIYDIIIKQIRDDIANPTDNISTLGKWLPRENSKLNKKTKFIDRFNFIFFPHIKNKISATKEYRKLKTGLNIKIGTLETKLCAKEYDKIDYTKVAPYALKKLTKTLILHPESKPGITAHHMTILKEKTLSEFVRTIMNEKQIINNDELNKIWTDTDYSNYLPFINIENSVCIIDLSNDTYSVGGESLAVGIALISGRYSDSDSEPEIENTIKLEKEINSNIKTVLTQIGPCRHPDIEKIIQQTNCKNLIIVTNKELSMPNIPDLSVLQIKPKLNTCDFVYYTNNDYQIQTNFVHTNYIPNNNSAKNIIRKILDKNYNYMPIIYFIMMIIFSFVINLVIL